MFVAVALSSFFSSFHRCVGSLSFCAGFLWFSIFILFCFSFHSVLSWQMCCTADVERIFLQRKKRKASDCQRRQQQHRKRIVSEMVVNHRFRSIQMNDAISNENDTMTLPWIKNNGIKFKCHDFYGGRFLILRNFNIDDISIFSNAIPFSSSFRLLLLRWMRVSLSICSPYATQTCHCLLLLI